MFVPGNVPLSHRVDEIWTKAKMVHAAHIIQPHQQSRLLGNVHRGSESALTPPDTGRDAARSNFCV